MCLDWFVVGQIIPMNPSSSVRGPKYVVKKGKTPVLTAAEARQLLDSIDTSTLVGLRDRALIAVMLFTFARVSAVVGMIVDDYYQIGKRSWISKIGCHTFRATGITAYLENGGTVENTQAIAAHESPRTTKLYDRTSDEITLNEIERIRI